MTRQKQAHYPSEFKEEALKLVASNGGSIRQIALSLGISVQTLHNWVSASRSQACDPLNFNDLTQLQLRE